jgi:hypothetical protein
MPSDVATRHPIHVLRPLVLPVVVRCYLSFVSLPEVGPLSGQSFAALGVVAVDIIHKSCSVHGLYGLLF